MGQCPTSSRAENLQKYVAQIRAKQVQIGAEMIFSVLMSSGVQSNLLAVQNKVLLVTNNETGRHEIFIKNVREPFGVD